MTNGPTQRRIRSIVLSFLFVFLRYILCTAFHCMLYEVYELIVPSKGLLLLFLTEISYRSFKKKKKQNRFHCHIAHGYNNIVLYGRMQTPRV